MRPDLIDRSAVVGPVDHCVTRLTELAGLGVDRFIMCGPLGWTDPAEEAKSRALLVETVLPGLRAARAHP